MPLSGDIEFYDRWWRNAPAFGESVLKSRERHRLLNRLLRNAEEPILVVGCGGTDEMSMVPNGMQAVGIDISSVAIEQSRSVFFQHSYLIADAVHLPLATVQFRTIVCSEVIEHIRDSDSALTEFHRLLDVGGRLLFDHAKLVSFYGLARAAGRILLGRDFTSGDQPYDKWYTKKSLELQLKQAGFCCQEWLGFWFQPVRLAFQSRRTLPTRYRVGQEYHNKHTSDRYNFWGAPHQLWDTYCVLCLSSRI